MRDDDDDDLDERPRPKKKKTLKRKRKKTLVQQPMFWLGLGGGVLFLGIGIVAMILLTREDKYQPTSPNDPLLFNIVAHWSFDTVTNNTVKDSSPNGNDGTIFNGTLGQGRKGQALYLTGQNNSYVDLNAVASKLSLPNNTNFTVAAWFQTNERSGTILAFRHTRNPCQFGLFVRDGRGIVVVGDDNDVANNNHAFKWIDTPNNGQWHHMAVTRSGPTVEVFYDGVSFGSDFTKQVSGPLTFDMCCIGLEPMFVLKNENRFGRPGFNGAIDEVYMFRRALSQQEIITLMGR